MILRALRLPGSTKPLDVRVDNGAIVDIAPHKSLRLHPGEELVDLEGRTAVPGLWDEHVHMGMWAAHRRRIDLRSATSAEEVAVLMRDGEASVPDDVVIGVGYQDGLWSTRQSLEIFDRCSGDRPWVAFSLDIHSCWLNSAALRRFGRTSPDGSGVLVEHEAFAVGQAVDTVSDAVVDGWVAEAEAEALSRGVVGLVDFDLTDTVTAWQRRRAAAQGPVIQVEAAVYPPHLESVIERGLRSGDVLATGVRLGPLKLITDGSLNTRTAYCLEPYRGTTGNERGVMNYPLDEMRALVQKATEAGIHSALHAIGDRANRIVLDLFDELGVPGRIEHAQLIDEGDLARFAEQRVTASIQPHHAVDDRDVADRYWGDRTQRAFPIATLLGHGTRVVFGSDAPVAPLDPWVQIAAAVTRTGDDRPPWHPEQRISLTDALRCSTRSHIEVGEPADLVIVDADPWWLESALEKDPSALAQALRGLPVSLTMIGGNVAYSTLDRVETG